MAVSDADLQTAVDSATTLGIGTDRVVDILQSVQNIENDTDYNGVYCSVRTNFRDEANSYFLPGGTACWIKVTDASNAATQAAEILDALSVVGPLDPRALADVV